MIDKFVLDVIKEKYEHLSSAERKVADYILGYPQEAIEANVSELAKVSGVSDATVIRMCRHLEYKGYYQFRLMLAKDVGRHEEDEEEEVRFKSEHNVVTKLLQNYADSLIAIGENISEEAMRNCVNLIKSCKQAHILTVGNTTPLGLYMGFRLGRLGIKCTYNISPEYYMNHVNLADEGDIVIAISQSGSSKQVKQGMELAKEKGLKIMAITGYKQSPISEMADHVLISNGRKEAFNYYKNYAHLKETAVIDVLLELLQDRNTIELKGADKPEVILSEYKY